MIRCNKLLLATAVAIALTSAPHAMAQRRQFNVPTQPAVTGIPEFARQAQLQIIALIIIGAAAGLVATRLMRLQTDLLTTVGIGVLGALVGGFVLRFLVMIGGWLAGFVGAVLATMLLIWIWQKVTKRR